MAEYLHFDRLTIEDFSEKNIEALYDKGYVFTRRGKGIIDQTRSLRIDVAKFELNSENKRILKKNQGLEIENLSLPHQDYRWQIGTLAKNFYDTKFGEGTFSANKIKELLTDGAKSNFNVLFGFANVHDPTPCIAYGSNPPIDLNNQNVRHEGVKNNAQIGYAICFESKNILHYSYPFYDLNSATKDRGMGMMLLAILYAQQHNKRYVYLGSAQRRTDTYKFQFKGIEWFDGKSWIFDLEKLKKAIR